MSRCDSLELLEEGEVEGLREPSTKLDQLAGVPRSAALAMLERAQGDLDERIDVASLKLNERHHLEGVVVDLLAQVLMVDCKKPPRRAPAGCTSGSAFVCAKGASRLSTCEAKTSRKVSCTNDS